jgi:hypothetical protein
MTLTCTCTVEDDGDPENGPHLTIAEVDESCPTHGRKANPQAWIESDACDEAYASFVAKYGEC